MQTNVQTIIRTLKRNYANVDEQLVQKAFTFAHKAHKAQKRYSGEAYITHPVTVAAILADLGADEQSIISAFLHDTVEDTKITTDDIKKEFGSTVAHIVSGLSALKFSEHDLSHKQLLAKNLRKMFMSIKQDLRIIVIKMIDRLHNMRTIDHLPSQKVQRKVMETISIYIPIANILGLWDIKKELEDICFSLVNPERSKIIQTHLQKYEKENTKTIAELQKTVEKNLKTFHIPCKTSVEFKGVYEVEKYLKANHISIKEYSEPFILTIQVANNISCYTVMEHVHSFFENVHYNLKDYISSPKTNFYQALHNNVISPNGEMLKMRIVTDDMYLTGRFGVLHQMYDPEKKSRRKKTPDWLQEILRISTEEPDDLAFLEELQENVLSDKIFVITKDSTVVRLPEHSSGIDYAFLRLPIDKIMSKGLYFKKNGLVCHARTALQNGDVLEIFADDKKGDHVHPLWLLYCRTHVAKHEIRKHLSTVSKKEAIQMGKEAFERELEIGKRSAFKDISEKKKQSCCKKMGYKKFDDILEEMGRGKISTHTVYTHIYIPHYKKTPGSLWMTLSATEDRSGFMYEIFQVLVRNDCNIFYAEGIVSPRDGVNQAICQLQFAVAPETDVYELCIQIEQLRDVDSLIIQEKKISLSLLATNH